MSETFAGKRAVGCVTYLREGTELAIGGDALKQKWTDSTPLLIAHIGWDKEAHDRVYVLQDSRGTSRVIASRDLAVAGE